MMRSERARVGPGSDARGQYQTLQELLLAVAQPPRNHSFELSGWPNWLTPAYRSGGHRPEIQLLEEE